MTGRHCVDLGLLQLKWRILQGSKQKGDMIIRYLDLFYFLFVFLFVCEAAPVNSYYLFP